MQLPQNPSISFSLTNCYTETFVEAVPYSGGAEIMVLVDGKEAPLFVPKIEQFLKRIAPMVPELEGLKFIINTSNTFPHGSGIASSASGMSALALCMHDIALQRGRQVADIQTVSEMARLGSGSACRSVFGPLAVWGKHEDFELSSDHYAIPFNNHHEIFSTYRDAILIVDQGEKSVSSTAGHQLLENHPFAKARYEEARKNMSRMKRILEDGDINGFVEVVELEALMLHALMMSSNPGFILMKAGTLEIIERIRAYRKDKNAPVCFTLDAGANVHMLYPEEEHPQMEIFIERELKQFCAGGYYICDRVGQGPERMK